MQIKEYLTQTNDGVPVCTLPLDAETRKHRGISEVLSVMGISEDLSDFDSLTESDLDVQRSRSLLFSQKYATDLRCNYR